jgi:hypothetical protein
MSSHGDLARVHESPGPMHGPARAGCADAQDAKACLCYMEMWAAALQDIHQSMPSEHAFEGTDLIAARLCL